MMHKYLEKYLQENIDVNATDEWGWTALHDAAIQGHAEIVSVLLEAGAELHVQDSEEHYTPLHDAARMNHRKVVQLCSAPEQIRQSETQQMRHPSISLSTMNIKRSSPFLVKALPYCLLSLS
jgi:ankyrin repeat protein